MRGVCLETNKGLIFVHFALLQEEAVACMIKVALTIGQ